MYNIELTVKSLISDYRSDYIYANNISVLLPGPFCYYCDFHPFHLKDCSRYFHFDNSNINIDTNLHSKHRYDKFKFPLLLRVDVMEMVSRQVMFAISIHDALVMQIYFHWKFNMLNKQLLLIRASSWIRMRSIDHEIFWWS